MTFSVPLADSSAEFRILLSYYTSFVNTTVSGPFSVLADGDTPPPPPPPAGRGYSFFINRPFDAQDAFPAYGVKDSTTNGRYFLLGNDPPRSIVEKEFSGFAGTLVRPIVSGVADDRFKMQLSELEFWEYSVLGTFLGSDRFCCVIPIGETPTLLSRIIVCLKPPIGTATFTVLPSPPIPYPGALRKIADFSFGDRYLEPTNYRQTGIIYFLDTTDPTVTSTSSAVRDDAHPR